MMDPSWPQLLERFGLPVFLIVFGCLIVWKLLPHVIEWLKTASAAQSVVVNSVPDIKEALQKIANEGQAKLEAIYTRTEVMEKKLDRLETQQDQMLERLRGT
jgi:hypothetical protein